MVSPRRREERERRRVRRERGEREKREDPCVLVDIHGCGLFMCERFSDGGGEREEGETERKERKERE